MTHLDLGTDDYIHCRRPFYAQEGGFYAQGPKQPAPLLPSQPPVPPPQYQQYPQPYPPPYQPPQTQPPMPPPKKSKAGVVIGVMVIVIILIVALLAYLFVLAPGSEEEDIPTITIEELNKDIQVTETGMDFKSYDKGDEIYVTGTIKSMKLADVPSGNIGVSSGTWTILFFENPNTTAIINTFAYKGDIRSDYTVGSQAKIKIKIDEIALMGISSEYPKEWLDASMVSMYVEIPTAVLDFTQSGPGNYTGSIVSSSADIFLDEIEIEIEDSSSGYSGTDDGDLTDDSPEEVSVWYGNLALKFTDANDNNMLDAGDVFILTSAEPGDEITIYDSNSYDEIASYTIV